MSWAYCTKCKGSMDLEDLKIRCTTDCPLEQQRKAKMAGDINKITDEDVSDFRRVVVDSHDGLNALDEYQRLATKTAIYPGHGTPIGLMYVSLKGAGEAGEFSEHVGKAMRDDSFVSILQISEGNTASVKFNSLTDERREKLILEAGDDLWYLSAKCNELGVTLSEVALLNLQKLNGRTKRGTLGGSGDNR